MRKVALAEAGALGLLRRLLFDPVASTAAAHAIATMCDSCARA